MEKKLEDEKILEKVDEEKRDFIKKVVVGTAFAVPVINSFSMEGLKIDLGGGPAFAVGDMDDDGMSGMSGMSGISGMSGGVSS